MVKENTAIGYIYGLYSNNNNEIRYIGYTVEPKVRLSKHIRESKELNIKIGSVSNILYKKSFYFEIKKKYNLVKVNRKK